ncbi:tetratricopeptide repeat protein [Myxococcota bacterium]|nr:tetratricopeptide repeat protein [Myxococcota bacterium]
MGTTRSGTDPGPKPKLRQGIDLTKLGLSLEEGFLLSRVDGLTTLQDLANIVGKPRADVEATLGRLAKAGVLFIDGTTEEREAARPAAPTADTGDLDYGDHIFPAALMNEACDLDVAERKRIIWFHEHLDTWTHYEILQAKRKDDAKGIKVAYFQRSKEWHPDRFRRPRLGSFKRMIDDIYKRVKEAYDVLSDEKQRAVYDETIVFMPEADEIAEMLDKQRREDRERLRDQEAAERRRRRNPMRQRLDKAAGLFEEALEHEKSGDLLGALRLAQTAATFDPRDEYNEAVERLKVLAAEHRIGPYMRRGQAYESMTRWDEAVDAFGEAVRLAPEHGPARLRLAYNLAMGKDDPQQANTHAQKAVALLPNEPEAHFVLGLCYEKGGMEKAAVRAYTRVLELKPNHTEAKKRLKKLRWGF